MPDDANPAITELSTAPTAVASGARSAHLRRAKRLDHGCLHGVKLMVASHLLDDAAAIVLEHDEVSDQIEKALAIAQTLDHDLQFRQMRIGECLAGDGPPRLEPLSAGTDHPDACLHTIGRYEKCVGGEK